LAVDADCPEAPVDAPVAAGDGALEGEPQPTSSAPPTTNAKSGALCDLIDFT
jgi:hypothetical protein